MLPLSRRVLRLVGYAAVLAAFVSQAPAEPQRPTVRVSTLHADIDPVTANWLIDQIHAANDDHAAALVIQLDTPISSSGSNIGSDLRNKAINDAVAKIQALAREHGRDPRQAAKAVLPKSRGCQPCPMNWTARAAVSAHVADLVAPSLPALLRAVDGRHLSYKDTTLHVTGARLVRAGLPLQDR